MLKDQPLLAPDRIGTDGAGPYPPAIAAVRKDGLLPQEPLHYVTKHLQQGIESDHFRVKQADAADRWFSVLPHGTTHDPGVRGHAVATKGLWVRGRLDGVRAEPVAVGLFRSPDGQQSLKRGPGLTCRAAYSEFATSPSKAGARIPARTETRLFTGAEFSRRPVTHQFPQSTLCAVFQKRFMGHAQQRA